MNLNIFIAENYKLKTQSTEQTPGVVTKLQNMKQVTFHQQSTQVAWQVSGCRVALPRPLAEQQVGRLALQSPQLVNKDAGEALLSLQLIH